MPRFARRLTSEDEGFLRGVDDLVGEVAALVNVDDVVDLGDEPVGEAEVSVGRSGDRGETGGCLMNGRLWSRASWRERMEYIHPIKGRG